MYIYCFAHMNKFENRSITERLRKQTGKHSQHVEQKKTWQQLQINVWSDTRRNSRKQMTPATVRK